MAGSKALAVMVGGAAIAGIAAMALAGNAKAATPKQPPKTPPNTPPKTPPKTPPSTTTPSTGQLPAGQIPGPWAPPYTVPSGVPGVPAVTITPGNPGAQANELATHLSALQLSKGGVAGARGHENKALVKSFQQSAPPLTADGMAGPATLIAVARRGTGVLPLVMYWPKGADQKTVATYRTALRAIANDAPATVADALRASADREKGQALGSANAKK